MPLSGTAEGPAWLSDQLTAALYPHPGPAPEYQDNDSLQLMQLVSTGCVSCQQSACENARAAWSPSMVANAYIHGCHAVRA